MLYVLQMDTDPWQCIFECGTLLNERPFLLRSAMTSASGAVVALLQHTIESPTASRPSRSCETTLACVQIDIGANGATLNHERQWTGCRSVDLAALQPGAGGCIVITSERPVDVDSAAASAARTVDPANADQPDAARPIAPRFAWSQDSEQVTIAAAVPAGISSADVECSVLADGRISLAYKEAQSTTPVMLLNGTLHGPVRSDETLWTISRCAAGTLASPCAGTVAVAAAAASVVEVTLFKRTGGDAEEDHWPRLLASGETGVDVAETLSAERVREIAEALAPFTQEIDVDAAQCSRPGIGSKAIAASNATNDAGGSRDRGMQPALLPDAQHVVPASTSLQEERGLDEDEADDATDEDRSEYRLDTATGACTVQVPLGREGHRVLFELPRLADIAGGAVRFCTRYELDALVLSVADSGTPTHTHTFHALAYVLSSKRDHKFVTCDPSCTYACIVELYRHVYVYRREPITRKRPRGSADGEPWCFQYVITLPPGPGETQPEVVGVLAHRNRLSILTTCALVVVDMHPV